jgi:hypothetical protein
LKYGLSIVGFCLLIGLTACGGGAPTATPTSINSSTPAASVVPTIAPTPTLPPTATSTPDSAANPLASLTHAFGGWLSAKSFRAHVNTTTGKTTTDSLIEVVMPDRFHFTNKSSEIIKIGNDFYSKTGTTWRKVTAPQSFDVSFADTRKIQEQLGLSSEQKFVGAEVLDGTPTLLYQYVTIVNSPPNTTTTKVWVGAADGLPRKSESLSKSGTHTLVLYSDYNANISIDPPIK